MIKVIIFDTETTGLPRLDAPLDKQPYICQFAAVIVEIDLQNKTYIEKRNIDQLIKPPISIPLEASNIHRITDDKVSDKPTFEQIVDKLMHLFAECDVAVAHNISFDQKLIEFELERLNRNIKFLPSQIFDTMKETTDLLQIPGRYGKIKSPTLTEMYKKLIGKTFEAHNALYDVVATSRCLKVLFDKRIFRPKEKDQDSLF